jgi:hypothetical protein
VSVITTHALFALKVQRKVSKWGCWCCYRRIIFGSEEIAAIRALQQCRSMANIGAEHC